MIASRRRACDVFGPLAKWGAVAQVIHDDATPCRCRRQPPCALNEITERLDRVVALLEDVRNLIAANTPDDPSGSRSAVTPLDGWST